MTTLSSDSNKSATSRRSRTGSPQSPPVCGIGLGAGGVQPLLELIGELPKQIDLALVLVVHDRPDGEALRDLIARSTPLDVRVVEDGLEPAANILYIAPPRTKVALEHGAFQLSPDEPPFFPIDAFFESLAAEAGSRAIGIMLAGGTDDAASEDGATGLRTIQAAGGITFAEDSAAARELGADALLAPADIARELAAIANSAYLTGVAGGLPPAEVAEVYALLRARYDVDFAQYKPSTFERRIRRRMVVRKAADLRQYVALLRGDPEEVECLYRDLLILVTGFFRDPAVYETLQRDVVPALLAGRGNHSPVRVWVPGCATGEEVYSLAMVFLELAATSGYSCPVQVFGTDINETAIEQARAGIYPEDIAENVSPERLQRFFTPEEGGGYRIAKSVRDCCVFARQNVTKDPPFSRLDLISCRNVMIYFGGALQRKVMSIFHYALAPGGHLLLGSSETIGNHGALFEVTDRRHRIYRKKNVRATIRMNFDSVMPPERPERTKMQNDATLPVGVFREADRVMLSRLSPPGVLINENMDVLQFRGRTSLFLEPPPGAATYNVLKMAREGLLPDLRAAILASRKSSLPERREGIEVRAHGVTTLVNLEVVPFTTPGGERYQLVLFEEVSEAQAAPRRRKRRKPEEAADQDEALAVARLKRELEVTREYLEATIQEQEAMNQELRSANEEIQSSNEELQSTNEELETAKEELQSLNEELTTLNEELEIRSQELTEANNDLVNLLSSVELPIVMLDGQLRIRRFNPGAQRVLNLIPADVGRPIVDLKMTLDLENLEELVHDVIQNLEVREVEVRDRRGERFSLRIRPYKTLDHRIEGAVLVLIDRKAFASS